jgi:hypothetical protein
MQLIIATASFPFDKGIAVGSHTSFQCVAVVLVHPSGQLGTKTDNLLINPWLQSLSPCGRGRVIFIERLT